MSRRNFSFFIIVVVLLLFLILLAPSYGWKLHEWLGPRGLENQNTASLAAQNEVLAARLAELQSVAAQIPSVSSSSIRAMAYSRYPLNFKDEILLNAGANEGVASGKAVLFEGILIGVVKTVFPDTALVTTVFDPTFKMPVRIGKGGVDALLEGGAYPQALSIAKSAKVAAGDVVVAAGPGVPYALPIGTVASISASSNDLFNQATLSFAYDINDVETVLIEK